MDDKGKIALWKPQSSNEKAPQASGHFKKTLTDQILELNSKNPDYSPLEIANAIDTSRQYVAHILRYFNRKAKVYKYPGFDTAFWDKVNLENPNDCWIWTAAVTGNGYGHFRYKRKDYQAHRISYEIKNNVHLSSKDVIAHSCDTPLCVNPDHLFKVTQKDNMRDMFYKNRKSLKLSDEDLARIINDPRGSRVVAHEYGVCKTTILNIRRGKRRKRTDYHPINLKVES